MSAEQASRHRVWSRRVAVQPPSVASVSSVGMVAVSVVRAFEAIATGMGPTRGYMPPAVTRLVRNKLAVAISPALLEKARALGVAPGGMLLVLDAVVDGLPTGVDGSGWMALVVVVSKEGAATYRALRGAVANAASSHV